MMLAEAAVAVTAAFRSPNSHTFGSLSPGQSLAVLVAAGLVGLGGYGGYVWAALTDRFAHAPTCTCAWRCSTNGSINQPTEEQP